MSGDCTSRNRSPGRRRLTPHDDELPEIAQWAIADALAEIRGEMERCPHSLEGILPRYGISST
jgi:hypothetical protein